MNKSTSLTNYFLVAMPSLNDPNFKKSVVYIQEHSENGAIGMIVNKPMQLKLSNVFEHMQVTCKDESINTIEVLMGGPVNQENGFIIYKNDKNDIEVSASKDMLQNLAKGQGPKEFMVLLGYSGWSSGQLEQEIMRNDWLAVPADPVILFSTTLNQRWRKTAKLIGVDMDKISSISGHG